MGYNSRQLKASPDPKAPAKPKDVIVDPKGQWKHPGKVTKIPGDTMATHGYGDIPLWVVPDVGPPRMVQPNTGIQVFPGANSFTEYPQLKGWLDTMQKGGTKIYTDKDLYDKAHKAEMDSLNAFNNDKKWETFLKNTPSDFYNYEQLYKLYEDARKKGTSDKYWGLAVREPSGGVKTDLDVSISSKDGKYVAGYSPVYKKPVIHNIYEPPIEPPQDTIIAPVVPIKHSVYHPNYTQEIPGVKKSKQVTKQEGGATSLRAVPTYASEKEQNKYTPYQRMVLQARANNQADREYNTVTGFVNLASHVPGPSQLLFSGLSSAVDFTEDNYAKSLLGLVPYKPFKIADAAGDVKDIYEQKKGGSVKGLSKFTSKNIKTSVNKLQMRNETLFGERGRKIYHPDAKGWLDKYK